MLSSPHKRERGADIPLRRSDIEAWMAPFSEAHLRGVQVRYVIADESNDRVRAEGL